MSAAVAERPPLHRPHEPESAFMRMHSRMFRWGQIMIRGRYRRPVMWAPDDCVVSGLHIEEDEHFRKREWTGDEIWDAQRIINARVIRMPLVQRIVCSVFYRESYSERWYELTLQEQRRAEKILTHFVDTVPIGVDRLHGVNERIRRAGEGKPIADWELTPIRERAVQQMVNQDRMMG